LKKPKEGLLPNIIMKASTTQLTKKTITLTETHPNTALDVRYLLNEPTKQARNATIAENRAISKPIANQLVPKGSHAIEGSSAVDKSVST
jgi:hypothetical protein